MDVDQLWIKHKHQVRQVRRVEGARGLEGRRLVVKFALLPLLDAVRALSAEGALSGRFSIKNRHKKRHKKRKSRKFGGVFDPQSTHTRPICFQGAHKVLGSQ